MNFRKRTRKLTPAEIERRKALERITRDPKASIEDRLNANVDLLPLTYEKPRAIVTVHSNLVGTFRMKCDPDLGDDELALLTTGEVARRFLRRGVDQ